MSHSPVNQSGVLRARRVMTMTPGQEGEAVWWRAGRIQLVGSASEVERAAPRGVSRYELPDALVTPGFVDGHTLLRAGAQLVFGSDVPVASLDPREGIYAALERKGFDGAPASGWHPDERLGFSDAIGAYTVAPARAAGAGQRRGALVPGYDADLVAWAVDPAAEQGDGEAFRRGRALLTVVGGAVVMQV